MSETITIGVDHGYAAMKTTHCVALGEQGHLRDGDGVGDALVAEGHRLAVRCLDEIAEQVRRALGLSMTAAQIESVLRGEAGSTGEQAREIIHREAGAYVRRLLSAIAESGLDARAMWVRTAAYPWGNRDTSAMVTV